MAALGESVTSKQWQHLAGLGGIGCTTRFTTNLTTKPANLVTKCSVHCVCAAKTRRLTFETLNGCVAANNSHCFRLLSLPGGLQIQHSPSCHGQCRKQCRAACGFVTLQHDLHLNPMSISRSPSSKISVCSLPIAWRLRAPCFRRSSRRPGVATRMWGGLFRRRLASVFTLVPPTTVCKGCLQLRSLDTACRVTCCTHAFAGSA